MTHPPFVPRSLKSEYETSPTNLDPATSPRFSWRFPSTTRGTNQGAYRIIAASSATKLSKREPDVWDSGQVSSSQSTAIVYRGPALSPETTYHWAVRVWTADGTACEWSSRQTFGTALSDSPAAWDGDWLAGSGEYSSDESESDAGDPDPAVGSPHLRTEFSLEDTPIVSATAHVATLGWGELHLNGSKVGDDVLNPGFTDYEQQILYSSYDVTDRLNSGRNAIGLWLGRGFFDKSVHDWSALGRPRGIVQLNVEYEDGTTDAVVTDPSWLTAASPIRENDIYDGETYDARTEQPGWSDSGFDDTDWDPARTVSPPSEDFDWQPQRLPSIQVTDSIEPASIDRHDGDWLVDFGQTLTGWVSITIEGASRGQQVRLEHAEVRVDEDGRAAHDSGGLNMADLRAADATDVYVAAGQGTETYEPSFTYHGFRHVRVSNYPGELQASDITAEVVRTDREVTGTFSAANDDLEDVHHMASWGLKTNTHSIPTDCPNRDERHGWTEVFRGAPGEYFEYDTGKTHRFYEKWLRDHRADMRSTGIVGATTPRQVDPQDPNWSKSTVLCPWFMYEYIGDERVLEANYSMMADFLDHWHTRSTGADPEYVLPAEHNTFGDWLAPTEEEIENDPAMLNTFALYQMTTVMCNVAAVLGKETAAQTYRDRGQMIKQAFNEQFYDPAATTYGSGDMGTFAMALHGGLVPEGDEQAVADELVSTVVEDYDGTIGTGSITTRGLLLSSLLEYGYTDEAYQLVSQPERPGWVYMARNGATTLWERWDSDDRVGSGMNSFNHRLWMEVLEWFYAKLVGIQPATPGFERTRIKPRVPTSLERASGETETVRGPITAAWEDSADGFSLDVSLPGNTTGEIWVPHRGGAIGEGDTPRAENATAVNQVRRDEEYTVYEVGSGSYRFHSDTSGGS